jgi:mRNA-degrading endonuclease RelE of RelBE toxin-antitoxin system
VINILIHPRFEKRLKSFPPEFRERCVLTLTAVSESFGDVHRHGGVGLRKLGKRSYESRVDLQWRIVFLRDEENLTAFDIMNHDEVRVWLRGR